MSAARRHLLINFVQVLPEVSGGIETYARELIPRLADRLDSWRISGLANSEGAAYYPQWDERVEWIDCGFGWQNTGRRVLWESTQGALKVRGIKPDLLHGMANTSIISPGCPQLTTVYDATQVLRPDPGLPMKVFRGLLRAAPRRADIAVTISHSAAEDIERAFGTPAEKIRVVHLAARPPQPAVRREELDARFVPLAGARYFLTPAARRANKNIPALLRAYASLPAGDRPLLVLAGADGGYDAELNALIDSLGIKDGIVLPGWVTDGELDSLYTHAVGLVFPSLMEGFGLPILEAMQCGCPVATSNVSSMPEVGGVAALYFDPKDEQSIAAAMTELATDEALRERLSREGRERAKEFSWERTAEETAALYEELLA